MLDAVLYQRSLGEAGNSKKDVAVGKFSEPTHKEMLEAWTPLVSIAQARGVQVPSEVSKSEKSEFEKLGKVKSDKYVAEYFQLAAKQSKRNARALDAAAKAFVDPELKTMATNLAKAINAQAEKSEATYKELKAPKKDAKK